MWERGLKPANVGESVLEEIVVPLVGTWIETTVTLQKLCRKLKSFPLWERGLKLQVVTLGLDLSMSFPLWERGLKLLMLTPLNVSAQSRSPCGNVD